MRRFTLIILSLALGCVWGCSGKTVESKSPSKTEATAAKNSPKTKAAKKTERETAKKTTDPAPKKDSKKVEQVAQNSNPSSANTNPQTDPEPSKNEEDPKPKAANSNDAKLPEEFAAFSYIPKNSFALVSARPSAVLNSPLVKAVKPEDIPLDEILADVGEKSGVDPRDVDRFTFAVWIGKGHAYPGQMQRNGRSGRRGEGKSSSKRAVKTERVFEKKIEAVPKDPPESPNVEATDEAPDSCDELPPEAQCEVAYQPGGLGGVFGPKFDGVVVLNFNKPFDLKRIEERNFGDFETLEHNGTSYHADLNTAYYMPNPKTLLLSPKGDMPTVLDNNQTADIVKTAIEKHLNHEASLIVDLKPTRLWLQGLAIMLDEQQPGLASMSPSTPTPKTPPKRFNPLMTRVMACWGN